MATAGEFRAEAARMREFMRTVTDLEILAELEMIIAEWERRARALGNGDGGDGTNCSPKNVALHGFGAAAAAGGVAPA